MATPKYFLPRARNLTSILFAPPVLDPASPGPVPGEVVGVEVLADEVLVLVTVTRVLGLEVVGVGGAVEVLVVITAVPGTHCE